MTVPFRIFVLAHAGEPLTEQAFKPHDSELRAVLKVFKLRFDDIAHLRRLEPLMRRLIFLDSSQQNKYWHGEGLDRLALLYEAEGDTPKAARHYQLALERLRVGDYLGQARVMRNHGLLLARTSNPEAGAAMIREALQLHDKDLVRYASNKVAVAKGTREQRLTECYLWCAMFMCDQSNEELLAAITAFALADAREFSHEDQQKLIAFALEYSKLGTTRAQQLTARLIQIRTTRLKALNALQSVIGSAAAFKLLIARKITPSPF